MPFPATLQLITLSGTFLDGEGNPRAGVVKVTLPTPIRSEGDNVIVPPFDLEIELDVNGEFSFDIPATTDPQWLPNTAEYVIQALFTEPDFRKLWWSFPLPFDTAGEALDLADAGAPNVGTPSLTIQQGTMQPLWDGGYKGTWGAGTLYRTGDTVQHGSAVYGALKASTGVTPGTAPTTWKVYPSSGGGGGAVDSVNGQTGDVVLDAGDVGADVAGAAATVQANLTTHTGNTSNPHGVTKAQVGLGSVDNTSDVAKPVSTAQASADALVASNAASALASHEADTTGIHGIADTSVLATLTDLSTGLAGKQNVDSDLTAIAGLSPSNDDVIQRKTGVWTNRTPAQIKTDLALVKADVGLGNVDNTSDANKPVSTATQTALDLKAPLASPALTGTATAVNLTQSGRYVSTPDVLTDAATIAVDASLGNDFTVTLGGDRTLGNPTNSANGQKIMFAIRQDGAGNRVLTLGSDYRLGTDIPSVVLSTGANKTDYLGVRYNGIDSKWDVLAFTKGY